MEIPKQYNPASVEDKWYQYWQKNNFFHSKPDDREAYTIVIPPPNVTGVLHMGHMLNNTIQDILIRRARMQGKNACWVPGTDHASIATEARVVAKLRSEGIEKASMTREEFLRHAWEWKEKHGGIILDQLKKLGASCDWERTKFTMDDEMSESVINVFIDLYKKGKIYRGVRMVNWDPQAKTALSDEEVIYREVNSKLYYVKYKLTDSNDFVSIATTRPETILGDTAVCVNPKDERFKHLKGKHVIVPMVNRVVPIIEDDYVDMEFGTGCLKITPAHDLNDYEIGIKHNLESIDIFNDDGTINEKGQIFVGVDRFQAREESVKLLKDLDLLIKAEEYVNKVGFSERTDAVIEPKLSMQWFVRMTELAKPALENVLNDTIKLYPAKYKNTYRHWMENVKDWCISRQLWWGQRIPAYYLPNSNEYVVAATPEEALEMAKKKSGNNNLKIQDLSQDEDVLDTWFSSWLWPISVFDGIRKPKNEDLKYYYPTSDLITAPEILFFWVARMIVAGYEFIGDKPFSNVYLTGIVRDQSGRKMSKSLGNSPDPLELIEKYSADGVRVGMLLCSPAGNDLLFDESLTEQGRNFANKIWNAFRLVTGWQVDSTIAQPEASALAVKWFGEKLKESVVAIEEGYKNYRLSETLMIVYKLFWDEFSAWYLELIKPEYQKPMDAITYEATLGYFETLLQILHPFMPFITEEIWHYIKNRPEGSTIQYAPLPGIEIPDTKLLKEFEEIKEVIAEIRTIRKEKKIANKDSLELYVISKSFAHHFDTVLIKSANLSKVENVKNKVEGSVSFRLKSDEFFIPMGENIDHEQERQNLKTELEYSKGFLNSVLKKLENESFVKNAPDKVIEMENKKKADTETKIKMLEERIAGLSIKK